MERDGTGVAVRMMRGAGTTVVAAALVLLAGCAGSTQGHRGAAEHTVRQPARATQAASTRELPGVGPALRSRIPADARQVVAVYGDGVRSADSTVVLYTREGDSWKRERAWSGHNGKRGWTTDHHEGDNKSPVGVFTLTDAGGVLDSPGSRLPYHRSDAFAAPRSWARSHWHDFDLVIAIDYNRVKGTSPLDPTRPEGRREGGGIWLHMDHGSGTSACVSQSRADMEYLLRTLDPALHPVVVMGDRAHLGA
ncbi:L,D-transpeptidase family protein [Streptomyces sp. ME01-24h]|nr:L,D-transpeptidase family protein [Streptomyces sp. ME19-03-3]MDX3352465.1 L,D-transpeptidase family protein [Streptomyces sp. ME01-24h]